MFAITATRSRSCSAPCATLLARCEERGYQVEYYRFEDALPSVVGGLRAGAGAVALSAATDL